MSSSVRVSAMKTLSHLFIYNTSGLYKILEDKTPLFLKTIIEESKNMRSSDDCRIIIYGLCEILKSDPRQAPEIVSQAMPDIMGAIVHLCD